MLRTALTVLVGFCAAAPFALAQTTRSAGVLAKMPVKEITVFKDGHCLVLHSGAMNTDVKGDVTVDDLPAPVLGTFWPYSANEKVKLSSTVSSEQRVQVERTALNLRDLIEANVGAEVIVTELAQLPGLAGLPGQPGLPSTPAPTTSYPARIESIPTRSIDELRQTNPSRDEPRAINAGDIVILKTETGSKVVNLARIQDVTFRNDHTAKITREEYRNRLTLRLNWPDGKKKDTADVGMMYLQKGIRWIPEYRVSIDGKGQATVELQATLLNELTDLEDVTANLVIGVPSFDFRDTIDPIALQQSLAQLSTYFRSDAQSAYAMSNAIMTQTARMGERPGAGQAGPANAGPARPIDLGPEVGGSTKNEDLFIFNLKHVTLKKGARMVVPVTKFSISYTDVYTLEIPFAPPPEVRRQFNNDQQTQLAKLFAAPKAMHKLRLNNSSAYPLTTGPALIVSNGQVLSQGMMTYTPRGSDCDLSLTAAVDVKVKKTDLEKKRVPNAENWMGDAYGRVDLEGTVSLTNYSSKPVQLEVTRMVLGRAVSATADGKVESVNLIEDGDVRWSADLPQWWSWYGWPYWWHHFNGLGRITWDVKLNPGQNTDLRYEWSYWWR